MFKSYLIVALRNIKKYKAFTFINVFGLAMGFASCILITLFIVHELSYDRFHDKADRIFRITFPDDVSTQPALALTLPEEIHEVEAATGFANLRTKAVQYKDKVFYEHPVRSASHDCFKIFTFPLIKGDEKKVLQEPNTVVLTESMAHRYFEDEDPLNKVIIIGDEEYRVDGVIEDLPENSHFDFRCLISNSSYGWHNKQKWDCSWMATYILVRESQNIAAVESKLTDFITKYLFDGNSDHNFRYKIQPLTSIHLHSNLRFELGNNGDFKVVFILGTVAVFMIIIACINFINLTTARSTVRVKEIGIRKAIGSSRRHLIQQFLGESTLMSLIAMVVAFVLVILVLPVFNNIIGHQFSFEKFDPLTVILGLLGFSILIGLIAGSYPAFYLSAFRPVQVMRNAFSGSKNSSSYRSGMVVFQFIISIVLLIGTFTVHRQMNYIQNKELGFDKEQVVVIQNLNPDPIKSETFKQMLIANTNIVSVSSSGNLPGKENGRQSIRIEGRDASSINLYSCDYDYLETLQLEMAKGRFFSKELTTDTAGIILNESAAKVYNLDNPIGTQVTVSFGRTVTGPVIGVIKDFHFRSLHEPLEPLAMVYGIKKGWGINYISVRVNTSDMAGTIDYIKETWKSVNPGTPFDYSFLDESYNSLHANVQTVGNIALVFCLLTNLVSCLGLYGLSAFVIERRIKEIGIRKVVGASVNDIVWMLSKNMVRLVFIAFVLAAPIIWIVMNIWLQNFAYRTEVGILVPVLSGLIALLIGFATVIFQSIRAARANPVEALKYE